MEKVERIVTKRSAYRVRVRNLPGPAPRETPTEKRARELFWAKHYWHQLIRTYKVVRAEAAKWRKEIKRLEGKR